jgi:uncharacterized protein YkwD
MEVHVPRTESWSGKARRTVLCAVMLLLVMSAAPAVARASVTATTADTSRDSVTLNRYERAMLGLINKARSNRGLATLRLRASLYRAAKSHSRSMIRRDYFSHTSRDGSTVAQRCKRAGYTSSGYSSWQVGEVIGLGSGSRGTAAAIFKMWMNSSAHRKVILAARWRDIGVGRASGTYKGVDGVRIFTVDFGRRTR